MTNYSRSVLLSNGLHHSENLPVKFGFSLKIVPATIAKKLPLQLRPKPLFIAFFSLSHKWLTFAFTDESGYTLGFRRKIAHSGLHAETRGLPSLVHSGALCRQRNFFYSATLLYTYISRFFVNPQHQQMRKIWQSCCHKFYPQTAFHRVFQLLAQTAHVRFHERKGVHTRLSEKNRTQGHTRRNTGRFGRGVDEESEMME